MSATTSRSLMFSVLLHGFVIAVALLLMLPANREQVVVPQLFEIFPSPAPSHSHAQSNPAMPGMVVKFPAVKVPVSRPATSVAAETADEPPARAPASSVPVHRTTAAEFQRQHAGSSKPAGAGPQVAQSRARINVDDVLATTDDASRSATSPRADENLAGAYQARLLEKLRVAHQRPAGLDAELQVRVEFLLRADGTLGNVRILRSSGSEAFDASVLAAFARLRDLGVPPAGMTGINSVTFRTSDGG